MAITINFNAETIVGNFCLGRIGEHNATELVITVPTALSEDPRTESYRVAFHTGGQTILSESYTESPITISLWRQLTISPRLSLQVIAYDGAGDFVGKSVKLSGFYFEPSVMGDSVEADGSNPDLAHEILDIMAKNAEQDARLDADEGNITALQSGKVDKVNGKGLSTEDFTTAEKNKLATLENYVLPIATTAVLGGVKVDGETIVIENGVIRATVQAGDYVRILSENSSGYSNYSVRALKDFHTEGKIVIYNECILEYSTETTNSIVYYFFDVKTSKQKKLTVSGSGFATITVVNLVEYASNNQGISGTIKTVNQWLTQFYGDIETLKTNVTTLTSAVGDKQNKFVEVTFTPTNSADWTQGGTFDKTFSEMAAAVSNGNMLTLKVDGSASFHALQVGGGSSSTYWWFVWYTGAFYSIALHHTLPDDEVQVYKFKYASDSLTIDGTTKTVAEWITQINGYNTITIGQITNTVAWWINTLQTNKANNLVQIDQATKSIGEWLAWILDGQSIDRFSEVESALNSLSSQIANKIDEPSSAGTEGQVLTLDSNLEPVWDDASGSLPVGTNNGDILVWEDGEWVAKPKWQGVFQPVEYIENIANSYIKLDYSITTNTIMEYDIAFTDTSQSYARNGSTSPSNRTMFGYNGTNDTSANKNKWYIGLGDTNTWISGLDTGRHTFKLDFTQFKGYIDGVLSASGNYVSGVMQKPSLFAVTDGNGTVDGYSKAKSYGVKIYESGVLARHYIPVYNMSGEIGMYEEIEHKFYTNAGTGTFIAGPNVLAT